MKFLITVECEDEFDREAVVDCVKNKLLIDSIYDDVFRPVFKYSDNKKEIKAFEMVWSKLEKYLE